MNIWSHLGTGIAMSWLLWWSFGVGRGEEGWGFMNWGGYWVGIGVGDGVRERDLWVVRYYLISGIGCLLFSVSLVCSYSLVIG